MEKIKLSSKYMLTIDEASDYFGIGEKKLRRILREHKDTLAVQNGVKWLVKRRAFEEFLDNTDVI